MVEVVKKKLNLSGLSVNNSSTTSSKESSISVEQKISTTDTHSTTNDNTDSITSEKDSKSSNKISLAGMKANRLGKTEKKSGEKETVIESTKEEKKEIVVNKNSENQMTKPIEENLKKEIKPVINTAKIETDKNSTLSEKKVTQLEKRKEINLTNNLSSEEDKNSSEKKEKIGNQALTESESLFSNYTSDFTKEEVGILEKIKNLKNLPKTRPLLVFGLLSVTALGIGLLFLLDPKKHSISHYKATLIAYYNKDEQKTSIVKANTTIPKNTDSTDIIIPAWENDSIIIGGYKITLESKTNTSGVKTFRYKGTIYENIETLEKELENTVQVLKKEKVEEFLLKNKSIKPLEKELKNTVQVLKEEKVEKFLLKNKSSASKSKIPIKK